MARAMADALWEGLVLGGPGCAAASQASYAPPIDTRQRAHQAHAGALQTSATLDFACRSFCAISTSAASRVQPAICSTSSRAVVDAISRPVSPICGCPTAARHDAALPPAAVRIGLRPVGKCGSPQPGRYG